MKESIILILLSIQLSTFSQTYTSYFTGNFSNITTNPQGGVCMMGGATEHDEAMKWFLERADGGDVLVLRASGSDGYNDYMYSELGVAINSVETIKFNSSAAANEAYIHNKIQQAEAIWFAGGDQWDYISYWRDTAIDSLINDAIVNRHIVIGGTSAGMAILGKYYFSASNGTVTSAQALNNPCHNKVQVDSTHFLEVNYLEDVITDTHYDDPNRKGRHVVFLARIITDTGVAAKGIACNEYTSVCIDTSGLASVYGDWLNYDEDAYFIQTNCELENRTPEHCLPSTPLTWNRSGAALKVYRVHGTNQGTNTFDLTDWQSGSGGEWLNWYVINGEFYEEEGESIDCSSVAVSEEYFQEEVHVFPNPSTGNFVVTASLPLKKISVYSLSGKLVYTKKIQGVKSMEFQAEKWIEGFYSLQIWTETGVFYERLEVR